MIDLCTLGTGGAIPLPDRALSSLYVRTDGRGLLIDCGEGTQTEIRRLGWGFKCIEAVLITHYHADHCGGLPGFLLSMAKTERTQPLHVYGPVGLKRVMEALCVIAPIQSYAIVLHELPLEETHFEAVGMQLAAFPLKHGMPCLGYRMALNRAPVFDARRAEDLRVPVRQWRTLQHGESVQLEDGRTVTPEQVTGKPRKGLSLVYATDTRPVEVISRMGQGTDLMILEGMYGGEDKREQALKNHHMLYAEAAALAAEAGTKRLALTHFSNCIEDPETYLPQAQAVFANTVAAFDGMIMTLRFPQREDAGEERNDGNSAECG